MSVPGVLEECHLSGRFAETGLRQETGANGKAKSWPFGMLPLGWLWIKGLKAAISGHPHLFLCRRTPVYVLRIPWLVGPFAEF